uniref:F-box domain-containing protein n=1 Tax=Caenorhabditis tropicalis TaxID=1561998 RepID=A0A1I7TNX0_9PELO
MHLLQIPVVALKYVFGMMNDQGIVMTLLTSKRAASIMQMCSIRTSTEIVFSVHNNWLKSQIGTFIFIMNAGLDADRYKPPTNRTYTQNTLADEPTTKSFIERVVKVYHEPKVILYFFDGTDVFAVELVRLLNYGPLREVSYLIDNTSPECYKAVFKEAVTLERFEIQTELPMNFQFSPSVSLNLEELIIGGSPCDWVKLEDFMSCKKVSVRPFYPLEKLSLETAKYLNRFFKKLKESECRLETLQFGADMEQSSFINAVDGLSDTDLVDGFTEVHFTRKDQKKLVLYWRTNALWMSSAHERFM